MDKSYKIQTALEMVLLSVKNWDLTRCKLKEFHVLLIDLFNKNSIFEVTLFILH